ncbi:hypothetical protein [Magnetospirillum fulvum]|uniref:Uncharacterized protein n=1 Tax=Magnetospirillum fulvum MGU-K5 TaxID=1316936 RepID=S9S4M6_MAGFU|nr:hypothetical protein [Magnetospirillum fulvum]EPY00917.1 hypothetical protein K678_13553 [Magnetospirillum fulvum MGU-K5]
MLYHQYTHVYGDPDTWWQIEFYRRDWPVARSRRPRRESYGKRIAWTLYLHRCRAITREIPDWDPRRHREQERNTAGYNAKYRKAGWGKRK